MSTKVNQQGINTRSVDRDDDDFTFGDIFAVLNEYKWLVFSIALGVFLLSAAYVLVATPIYQADSLLQVEEEKAGIGGLDISELFEGNTSVNAGELKIRVALF
jgi:tyrosine-protein kinase Etk/Wzc